MGYVYQEINLIDIEFNNQIIFSVDEEKSF